MPRIACPFSSYETNAKISTRKMRNWLSNFMSRDIFCWAVNGIFFPIFVTLFLDPQGKQKVTYLDREKYPVAAQIQPGFNLKY